MLIISLALSFNTFTISSYFYFSCTPNNISTTHLVSTINVYLHQYRTHFFDPSRNNSESRRQDFERCHVVLSKRNSGQELLFIVSLKWKISQSKEKDLS